MMIQKQRNQNGRAPLGDLFAQCVNISSYKQPQGNNPIFAALGQQLIQNQAAFKDKRSNSSKPLQKKGSDEINESTDTAASSNASGSQRNSSAKRSFNRQPLGANFLSDYRSLCNPAKQTPVKIPKEITPCQKVHENCGHACAGVEFETQCLPCLEPECQQDTRANKDDLCNICFTSELSSDPAVKLGCGHIFHAQCVRDLFSHKWSSLRMTFDFLSCPACKTSIKSISQCPQLQTDLSKLLKLKASVLELAQKFAAKGKIDLKPVNTEGDQYYNKKEKYILNKCAFYECNKCKKPFYGGLADCERDLQLAESTRKEDLLCKGCMIKSVGGGQFNCNKHGHKHITWKCFLCCSEALYKCGNSYFCDSCHQRAWDTPPQDCGGVNCPLGVPHPPASRDPMKSMYPLGCSLCRMEKGASYVGVQGLAVEEIKLDNSRPKVDLSKAEMWEQYDPLYDEVQIPQNKKQKRAAAQENDDEARERQARREQAEKYRQQAIENKRLAVVRERKALEAQYKEEAKRRNYNKGKK